MKHLLWSASGREIGSPTGTTGSPDYMLALAGDAKSAAPLSEVANFDPAAL
jgi:hypothetical protein